MTGFKKNKGKGFFLEDINEFQLINDKVMLLGEGDKIKVGLTLKKTPTENIYRNLKKFIKNFEISYADVLPKWKNQLDVFKNAEQIVNDVFNISIVLPHEIKYEYDLGIEKKFKNPQSKEILKIAKILIKESEKKSFFIPRLINDVIERTNKSMSEIFAGIKELRELEIIVPLEITKKNKEPISDQQLDLIRLKVSSIPYITQEEIKRLKNYLIELTPQERNVYMASFPQKRKIDNIETAKEELKFLKQMIKLNIKEKQIEKAIYFYQDVKEISKNWNLTNELEELQNELRLINLRILEEKLPILKEEAEIALGKGNYTEAVKTYKKSLDIASELVELGKDEMIKDVLRLSDKLKNLFEKEAEMAVKKENYEESIEKYQKACDLASEMFKLGNKDALKEIKRLTKKLTEMRNV